MNEALLLIKELAFEGKSAEEISREMDNKKVSFKDTDLEIAKRRIDDFVIMFQMAEQAKSNAFLQMVMGAFLLILGLGITVYTIIALKSQFVLMYGGILAGAYFFWKGYTTYKKPLTDLVPEKIVIKNRP